MRKASRVVEHPEAVIDSLLRTIDDQNSTTCGHGPQAGPGITGASRGSGDRCGARPAAGKSGPPWYLCEIYRQNRW